jgi:ribosomal protein L11 methyltransferase
MENNGLVTGSPLKTEIETQRRGSTGPYKDLFIYHLKGQVGDEEELVLGEHFLGNWLEDDTSFLFFSMPSRENVSGLLRMRSDLELIEDYNLTYEEWQGSALKPMVIERFLIHPPWEEWVEDEGKTEIILDPGVVFGTGLHPTTKDCLKALVHLHRQSSPQRVLDLGTGTGILALAAALLGAERVLAVDLNPLSVKTAQTNVGLNNLEGSIEVVRGLAEDFVQETADLIVANLQHSVIVKLLERKGFLEKRWFIISGLLRSEVRDIRYHLVQNNLDVVREWDHENTWYTLLVRNNNVRGRVLGSKRKTGVINQSPK